MKTFVIFVTFFCCLNSYSQDQDKKRLKKNIQVIDYYENGNIKEKGKKKYQMKISATPTGRTSGLMTYFKNGKWIEYYPNGKKKRMLIYKEGEIVKVIKVWEEEKIEEK